MSESNQKTISAQNPAELTSCGCHPVPGVSKCMEPVFPGEKEDRMLFTCMHAGVGVAHASFDGSWQRFNQKFCQITGCTRGQLLQKKFQEITHADDWEENFAIFRQVTSGQVTSTALETRFLRPDGSIVWVRLALSLAHEEEPDCVIVVAEDISLRKQAEAANATLAAIVQYSNDAIVSMDLHGAITSWNAGAERLFGFSSAEAIGQQIFILAPGKMALEAQAILEQVKSGQVVQRMEVERVCKDGKPLQVAISVSPIRDPGGRIIGVATISRDIGALKAAEQALRQARQELAQANAGLEQLVQERTAKLKDALTEMEYMSYSIIHDMRAPLRAIVGFGDILEKEAAPRLLPQERTFLGRIKAAADRMDHLIRDVLNYSALVRQQLELRPLNVPELLRGIIDTYPALQAACAQIDISPDIPQVQANPATLTQCFSNLLDNAVKFAKPGQPAQIRIYALGQSDRVRIIVEDKGIGIPRELHERIFQLFQRGNTAHDGTGIGLAIVRKAAERMGGKAGVHSVPGEGSRFWLELKAA